MLPRWKSFATQLRKGIMGAKTDSGWDKKSKNDGAADKPEKIEKKPTRRMVLPPEEKMKRGRGLVVFLFLVSVLASYLFSLIKDSR